MQHVNSYFEVSPTIGKEILLCVFVVNQFHVVFKIYHIISHVDIEHLLYNLIFVSKTRVSSKLHGNIIYLT